MLNQTIIPNGFALRLPLTVSPLWLAGLRGPAPGAMGLQRPRRGCQRRTPTPARHSWNAERASALRLCGSGSVRGGYAAC
jgi:hypothetical protein